MSDFFAALWTVDRQAPLSMGFPRQEYWSGMPFPPAGDLPDRGIEPTSPTSLALQAELNEFKLNSLKANTFSFPILLFPYSTVLSSLLTTLILNDETEIM